MERLNDEIRKLIAQRDEIEIKIQYEVQKERDSYKFSWDFFLMLVAVFIGVPLMFYLNNLIFPVTSIWSYHHYMK